MDTNYYAYIIPTKKKKDELKKMIDNDELDKVLDKSKEMYGNIEYDVYTKQLLGCKVHLGKSSIGWKFLWNPQVFLVPHGHYETFQTECGEKYELYAKDPSTLYHLYPLTKKGITHFVMREDVVIRNEYGESVDKEGFLYHAMVEKNTYRSINGEIKETLDSRLYEEIRPCRIHISRSELVKALEAEGHKMISKSLSDFYSDGLRFSTITCFERLIDVR